jgi:hydroxyacylglutathione hydrolase
MLQIIPVEAFTDNYIWLIHNGSGAIVVDPGDARPVLEQLTALRLELQGILITHHHTDHTGGIAGLAAQLKGPIYAPCPTAITHTLQPDPRTSFQLLGIDWRVLAVPGHTQDHVAYWGLSPDYPKPMLFCGDTLFSVGCGRLLQGTAQQLYQSLNLLEQLPPETEIYCAHEYTIANIRFALAADPNNFELQQYLEHCLSLRLQNRPTLPSTLAKEKAINPFLRCTQPDIIHSALANGATCTEPLQIFSTLRQWKNHFQS